VAPLAGLAVPAPPGDRPEPDPPRYDLRPGSPDVTTFPRAAWLRAMRRALSGAPPDVYGYGDPRGRIELRTALAGYLGRTRGVAAGPEQIVVTSGYVAALALLARVLRDGGTRAVAMEDPGLGQHREVVRRAGAEVVALPVDDRGARVEQLAGGVGAAVVTPAHQYPIGVSLHPARRRALAGWARERGALVVEDDYDGEFRYDRQPVGALQGTAPDHVAYLGTVSKTLAPALRLGWMVLPRHLVEPVVAARLAADLHTEVLGQLALADLIASHAYDRHVRACRLRYRRRRDLLLTRLRPGQQRHGYRVRGVAAGLHALVMLAETGPGEAELAARAGGRGLALGYLGELWHAPGPHPQGVIVGYGTPPEHRYPPALDALARVITGQ
jgi:GntR family transcriptional regulator/MocR family aminotransferase